MDNSILQGIFTNAIKIVQVHVHVHVHSNDIHMVPGHCA